MKNDNDKKMKEVLAANIARYMERKGVDKQQVCADTGIAYTTLVDWLKAKTFPRMPKVELLANYFGCEKSDLIQEKVIMPASERGELEAIVTKNPETLVLVKKYLELSEENKKAVRQIVHSLPAQQPSA